MKKYLLATAFGLSLMFAENALANQFKLPIQLDYSLIKKIVVSQLYTGNDNSAELWHDKHGCSFLKLSNLQINGLDNNIRLLNDVEAQFGTSFGSQCMTLLQWRGVLETWQQPTLNADHSVLSLPVSKAVAYDRQGRRLNIDKLQDLLQRVAEPKLAEIKIDLNKSRDDMTRTLVQYLPQEQEAAAKNILNSLKFNSAEANEKAVAINIGFEAPTNTTAQKNSAALTVEEQQQFQTLWREWDDFLSKTIRQAADDAQSAELRDTLTEILLESRQAFQAGIAAHDDNAGDPVRTFFIDTWERLAPQLRTLAKQLPEVQSLRYLTFITATDLVYELENLGAPFGISISSDGLRKLGRLLIAGQLEQKG